MASELEAALPPVTAVGRQPVNCGHPPSARYGVLSERLRRTAPGHLQCSVFCGGRKGCKYDTPHSHWHREDMAVNGIYSHWITNDILAMARPNTEAMEKYNVIQQFRAKGVCSVINLQVPGEHPHCSPAPLHPDSGFSYHPQLLMDNDVFFYNFRWKDYGTVSETMLLDMVKVMAFALTEGKVAVHCHAGLGRTGVLIACYLVFWLRCKPNDAIRYIRIKRPCAIQTRSQISCVQQFAQFILPLFTVFTNVVSKGSPLSLQQHVTRQRRVLHGIEARQLKFIPKVVYVGCEQLLRLCGRRDCPLSPPGGVCFDLDAPVCFATRFLSNGQQPEGGQRWTAGLMDAAVSPPDPLPPPSRGAAYYLEASPPCDSRDETPDYVDRRLPPDGRSTGSMSAGTGGGGDMYGDFLDDDYYGDMEEDDSIDLGDHTLANNTCYQELAHHLDLSSEEEEEGGGSSETTLRAEERVTASDVTDALLRPAPTDPDTLARLKECQRELNGRGCGWERLRRERDPRFLAAMLFAWMDSLKDPVLTKQDLTYIVLRAEKPVNALLRLDKATRYTTEYLVRFVGRLEPRAPDPRLRRLLAALTRQGVGGGGACGGGAWPRMREGTARHLLLFARGLHERATGLTPPSRQDDHAPSEEGEESVGGGGRGVRVAGRDYLGLNLMAKAIGKPTIH